MSACAWVEVFGDLGEPVPGDPSEYGAAAEHARVAAGAMAECARGFAGVAAGTCAELRGATAQAIGAVLSGIDGSIHDLPSVFDSLAAVLSCHRDRLDALRAEAAVALERASLRWSEVHAATAAADAARASFEWIDRQTRSARDAAVGGDPAAHARAEALESQRWSARRALFAAEAAHDEALTEHAISRVEHAALADEAVALNRTTRESIGQIELGDLRDPSGWLNTLGGFVGVAWEWTGGAVVQMVDGLIDASFALVEGRFMDALHHLNDALDGALRLLTTITVAVAAVGVLVCPGALVLVPGLLAAGQGLGAAHAATGVALLATQHAHPDTGEPIGVVAVLGALAGTLLPARARAGGALTSTAAAERAVLARAGARSNAARVFVRTPAENAMVLATRNGQRMINPATGRVVSGAARRQMVNRATLEANAYRVQVELAEAVDTIVVGNAANAAARAGGERAMAAVHPDAEATFDRVVFGSIAAQARAVRDTWRRGPSLRPSAAPYLVVAA